MSCLIVLNICRPPGLLLLLLSSVSYKIFCPTYSHSLMIWHWWGDCGLHIDSSSVNAGQLSGILGSFDLHQYIVFPTHIHGHSLDLMIRSTGCNVLSVSTFDLISGHFSVVADLQFHPTIVGPSHKLSSTESYNRSTLPFKADIQNSEPIRYLKINANGLAQQYDRVLHTLINL